MPLVQALWNQRLVDLYEFKTSQVFIESYRQPELLTLPNVLIFLLPQLISESCHPFHPSSWFLCLKKEKKNKSEN